MTQEERDKLKISWVQLSAYYGRKIDDGVLNLYVEDLEDLNFESVVQAMTSYRRDPKNRMLPLPAQIRDIVSPEPTDRDLAEKMLERVMAAIRHHGYMNYESAKADIGDEAWTVVERMGGWYSICTNPDHNPGVFRAQFLNAAESYCRAYNYDFSKSILGSRYSPRPKELEMAERKIEALKLLEKFNDLNSEIKR